MTHYLGKAAATLDAPPSAPRHKGAVLNRRSQTSASIHAVIHWATVRVERPTGGSKKGCVVSLVSNVDLIRRVPLFSKLTDVQIYCLANVMVKRRFKRGQLIVEQGKNSRNLYVLLDGRARVFTRHPDGREAIISMLRPGDCIGEMSLIDDEPHCASVSPEIQTDALVLSGEAFASCMPERDTLAFAMLRGLTGRLRLATRKIASLSFSEVRGRVVHALLEVADRDPSGLLLVQPRMTRQDIAKMVGASREMVTRAMLEVEASGHIETLPHGAILLNNLEAWSL